QNDKLTHSSMSIMQDPTVKRLTDVISIIERLTEYMFKESMSGFEKTAAEKTDINDIIKIISMKKMSMSFKHKILSLIALNLSKHIQI
ncbi:hypothetical protein BDDG_12781, partial [Blastomyces dermatitidis ATCC 18188]